MVKQPQQTEAVITARQLTNAFGTHVVHDKLDLDLLRGEILGVVGGSGTGKSVLLRTLVGLRRPSAGTIKIFGEDVNDDATNQQHSTRCGVLFQNGALFSSQTINENIALPLIEHAGLSRSAAMELAGLKLVLTGLDKEVGALYPAELSGGMIKRAALARALALDPDILFLDEPTAGLDPIAAAAFDSLILTLRAAFNLSVFLVTHDLDTLYTICDRVAVLAQRKVLVAGNLATVTTSVDPWVQQYFHGPRGRSAQAAHLETKEF